MPLSRLKERKKKKKKSLWLTLVLIVEEGCVSYTFFLHLQKIMPLPLVDLQSTISLFSRLPVSIPFAFSFPSLLQVIDIGSKTPILLHYFLLQFQYNKATKKVPHVWLKNIHIKSKS